MSELISTIYQETILSLNKKIAHRDATIAAQEKEIAALQKKLIHCDSCGATWYDDGFCSTCPICEVERLKNPTTPIRRKGEEGADYE